MAVIRALLVEDHTALRQALGIMLEREPDLVVAKQAGSLAEARGMLEGIDLAVVDLQLPDGTGVDVISELLERNPQAAVLVLTASLDRELFGQAVEAGAAGVLHKTAGVEEVIEAVRKIRAGEQIHTTAEVMELMRLGSRRRERDHVVRFAASSLTPRERQILDALAEGLTSREIADRLGIALETEHAHLVRLFSKLGVHSRVGALAFGLRHGLVTHDSPTDP
jgi:two-component system nitrate/nitrite response regulator NarL